MFDVCTTGDTAHIDTIFKFLPHTLKNLKMGAGSPVVHTSNTSSCKKKKTFSVFLWLGKIPLR
jgi:hypothetical protein